MLALKTLGAEFSENISIVDQACYYKLLLEQQLVADVIFFNV